jgi:hypothetical protein
MANGILFSNPINQPLSSAGLTLPLAYFVFYLTGTTTPAAVYQDAGLTTPFPPNSAGQIIVTAGGNGQFAAIYMNPSTVYRVQLYTSGGVLLSDTDPIIPPLPTTGTNNVTLNPVTGEVTINQPAPGGSGIALTVVAPSGGIAIELTGVNPGTPLLEVLNTLTTGTQTATFAATNKPGTGTTAPSNWLPIIGDGGTTYYIPLWQ